MSRKDHPAKIDEHEIYHAKHPIITAAFSRIPEELLNNLRKNNESAMLEFGSTKNSLSFGDSNLNVAWGFSKSKEESPVDLIRRDGDGNNFILFGEVHYRFNFKSTLNDTKRDQIRNKTEEAERDRLSRKAIVLDSVPNLSIPRRATVNNIQNQNNRNRHLQSAVTSLKNNISDSTAKKIQSSKDLQMPASKIKQPVSCFSSSSLSAKTTVTSSSVAGPHTASVKNEQQIISTVSKIVKLENRLKIIQSHLKEMYRKLSSEPNEAEAKKILETLKLYMQDLGGRKGYEEKISELEAQHALLKEYKNQLNKTSNS